MYNKKKQSDYFNIDEICQILHISRATATRLCKKEGFPCIKIGRLYRISKEGFYKWVSDNMEGAKLSKNDDSKD